MSLRLKTWAELRRHRAGGHVQFSPDCPECRQGAGVVRPHARKGERVGGDLSIDIAGPFEEGLPVTDRPVSQAKNPVYFLVGAFVPFSREEANGIYVAETEITHAHNIQGPVQLETQVDDKKKTLYFTEVLPSKRVEGTEPALLRMKARIDSMHRCKAVFRIHADRAQELSGERISAAMAKLGVLVTSTAGVDSNANGRAERGVRWVKELSRTLLMAFFGGTLPIDDRKMLWPFAVTHCVECHLREFLGEPECKFAFGNIVMVWVKEPLDSWEPRYRKAVFLGYAPDVSKRHS